MVQKNPKELLGHLSVYVCRLTAEWGILLCSQWMQKPFCFLRCFFFFFLIPPLVTYTTVRSLTFIFGRVWILIRAHIFKQVKTCKFWNILCVNSHECQQIHWQIFSCKTGGFLEGVLNKSMLKMLQGILYLRCNIKMIYSDISLWFFPPNLIKNHFLQIVYIFDSRSGFKFSPHPDFHFLTSQHYNANKKKKHNNSSVTFTHRSNLKGELSRIFESSTPPHYQLSNLSLRKHKAACLNQLNSMFTNDGQCEEKSSLIWLW